MPDGYVSPPLLQTAPISYGERETHEVLVENGRLRQHEFTLDRHGFELLDAPSAVAELHDEAVLRRDYYPEVEALLRRHLGASEVMAFDHRIRRAGRAHHEDSHASAPQRVRDLLPEEADRLLAGRFAIVTLWRPLGPVQKSPLALAEWSSLAEADLVPTATEALAMRHSPRHAWVYFPHQLPREALLTKAYDSATDGRARLSIQREFEDPSSPPDAPAWESVEVRALVFWD